MFFDHALLEATAGVMSIYIDKWVERRTVAGAKGMKASSFLRFGAGQTIERSLLASLMHDLVLV